jgi:Sulfotransferase domain
MLQSLLRSARDRIRRLHLDLGNYRRTVLLAGTGRSGTTWVQDIINFDGSYRVMFEPFHSRRVEAVTEWNYRQYLRPGNRSEIFLKPATRILSGRISHEWIDQFNRKRIARKRLIKCIRANLFLKWIKRNFPLIPIVLLLRHPCAVAHSKIKLAWDTHLQDFLIQDDLVADFLAPFRERIEAAGDGFDRHIIMWCIENYVPLRQFRPGEILVTFYEDICVDAETETRTILKFLGAEPSTEVLRVVARPSARSRQDSAIRSGENLVSSWRKEIAVKQIARAGEILTAFGLQAIYDSGDMPIVSGRDALSVLPPYREL